HSLYVPRDFDVSPYFAVVKPSLDAGFDYRAVTWAE
ncbi:MAG: lipo-like protein, partial [Methylocella sp.]